MASAIIGGLLNQGTQAAKIVVVEPFEAQRTKLQRDFGVTASAEAGAELAAAQLVVWAVKPQLFQLAAAQALPHLAGDALHLSVAAGVRSDSIASWLGSDRIVRAMPNTPALINQGMTGLYARVPEDAPPQVDATDLSTIEQLMDTTGQWLWVREEKQLDAVTAISGSGPAYVFYWLESMVRAGIELDLDEATAKTLAIQTVKGAVALAAASTENLATLRANVTSKGGTTHAALESFRANKLDEHITTAIHAAAQRAKELGDEFGR